MQFEQIDRLLQKYYDGETTLAEEAQLKDFFREVKLLPDHLKLHAAQFNHYDQAHTTKVDKFLADDWLFEKIESPATATVTAPERKLNFFQAYGWQMAASISLLLVAFWAGHYFWNPATTNSDSIAQNPISTQQKAAETQPSPIEEYTPESNPSIAASDQGVQRASSARPENTIYLPEQRKQVRLVERAPQALLASARLQLVSQDLPTEGLSPEENKRVMNLLIKTMSKDDNMNVRLAACEALYRFKDQKEARQAFIQALATQTDPMMQITLIDIVISLKEKRALPQLEQLANQENVLPIVKHKAQEGLGTLI